MDVLAAARILGASFTVMAEPAQSISTTESKYDEEKT
jgi:hypothetical protein